MATRFRITADATTPAVSPAYQSYTHALTSRRKLLTSDASALATTAVTPDAADHLVAGDAVHRQWVSDPIAAGKVFTNGDVIKLAMQGLEAHTNNNLFLQLFVSVVDSAGTTVQRVLRSKVLDGTEIATALTNRFLSTTQDGATYTTAANDRLVVEISVSGTPAASGGIQGHNASIRTGGNGAGGDLPENDTETGTTFNPWIEFVPDLFTTTFQQTIAATSTFSPDMADQLTIVRALAVTSTFSPVLGKLIGKVFAVTSPMTVALQKQMYVTLAVSSTFAVEVRKKLFVTMAVASTFAAGMADAFVISRTLAVSGGSWAVGLATRFISGAGGQIKAWVMLLLGVGRK